MEQIRNYIEGIPGRIKFYPVSMLMVLATVLYACSGDPGGGSPGGGAGEKGFLSVEMAFEDILPTRADAGESGIGPESLFNSIAFILYDGSTGKAVRVDAYTLADDGTVLTATDSEDNLTIGTGISGEPVISKVFEQIEPRTYKLAVILNNGTGAVNLNAIYPDESLSQSIAEALSVQGHDISVLEGPLEISKFAKGGALYDNGIGLALTAMPLSFPDNVDVSSPANTAQMRVLMTNADGLYTITSGDVYETKDASQLNKINIRLERTVAKVAVFKNLDEGNLSYGAKVEGVRWTSDIVNNHMYLVRRQAPTAPYDGGGMETPSTDRAYRYARDPNFDGQSRERDPSLSTDMADHFFRLQDVGTSDIDKLFLKTWNTVPATDPAENWTAWEYLTENTMAAGEQYEDVTTRVVIKCNYIPGSENSIGSVQAGEGYYHFNGLAITNARMKAFYADPATVPVKEYPGLEELPGLLADPGLASDFGWPQSFDTADKSRSARGISYFHEGINYYRVLIRHFDDGLSPDMMGYGRYGVVRNNVYKISINDIKGPGSINIPDPEGPDDKEFRLDLRIEVAPWNIKYLVFEL